jgi:chromate transporter
MSEAADIGTLSGQLALLSSISFGGIPSVLPDIRNFVVAAHGWISEREFANFFAVAQAIPGPNMILMMSFIGWKIAGLPGAAASAAATFAPPCLIYFTADRLWHRFRHTRWQRVLRDGLAPLTIGLVGAAGIVMARPADASLAALAVTAAATILMLRTRLNPLWVLGGAGALGGLGLL